MKTWPEIWEVASQIDGATSENELLTLYSLAINTKKPRTVVEVGCDFGRSTYVLANTESNLVVVDNFCIERPGVNAKDVFFENMKNLGMRIDLRIQDSFSASQEFV